MAITKILVVVDKSLASMRAVTYVARVLGGRRGFRICLAHTLPSLPAAMMEFAVRKIPGRKNGWKPAFAPAAIFGRRQRRERRPCLWSMPTQNCATRDLRAERSKFISAFRAAKQTRRKRSSRWRGSVDATRLSLGESHSPGFVNCSRQIQPMNLFAWELASRPGW